jgi:hypothetical protein
MNPCKYNRCVLNNLPDLYLPWEPFPMVKSNGFGSQRHDFAKRIEFDVGGKELPSRLFDQTTL